MELVDDKRGEIESIYVVFNCPKNPCGKGGERFYDREHGGAMLDLGVYVFEEAREILKVLGMGLDEFDKENKEISIRYAESGVDSEVIAVLKYG